MPACCQSTVTLRHVTAPGDAPISFDASTTVELANRFRGELNERLGLLLTEVSAERVVGTLPVAGNRQPYGLLHGGASAALAETLGSVCAAVNAGPGRIALGVELNASHHRSVRDGTVTGVARPVHVSRSIGTFDVVVTDEAGRRVCTARLTCLLRDAGR
jgi:1,4-dihydroxy-2-naphthoyl-CoA hydrolase